MSTIWAEVGDAGELPGGANITTGTSPLTDITGEITGSSDADMYLIYISDFLAFSATTVGQPGSTNDTQLFLFDATGFGVYANDDSGLGVRSTLPASHASGPTSVGLYYLAISSFNRDPASVGGLIFPNSFGAVHGPTGPGGGSPITGYTSSGGTGTYSILLTGADPSDAAAVPEPVTMSATRLRPDWRGALATEEVTNSLIPTPPFRASVPCSPSASRDVPQPV